MSTSPRARLSRFQLDPQNLVISQENLELIRQVIPSVFEQLQNDRDRLEESGGDPRLARIKEDTELYLLELQRWCSRAEELLEQRQAAQQSLRVACSDDDEDDDDDDDDDDDEEDLEALGLYADRMDDDQHEGRRQGAAGQTPYAYNSSNVTQTPGQQQRQQQQQQQPLSAFSRHIVSCQIWRPSPQLPVAPELLAKPSQCQAASRSLAGCSRSSCR